MPRINIEITGELRQAVKIRAAAESRTVRDIVTVLLTEWLADNGSDESI